jgi:hypothetical protein
MKATRWVSESEAKWAAELFAENGTAVNGSRYGRPCKRVRIANIKNFQAERLVARFGGQAWSESWRCDGRDASFFLRTVKPYAQIAFTEKKDLPMSDLPTCNRPTKNGTLCQRIARNDLGHATCWTHRTVPNGE